MDLDREGNDALVAHVGGPRGTVRVRVWPALGLDTDRGDTDRGDTDPDDTDPDDTDPDDTDRGDTDRDDAASVARRGRGGRGGWVGPVLLAFHGWTDSGEVFGPLAQALARRWTIVAPDAPGHGGTSWRPSAEFRLDDQIGTGLAVLDALPARDGRRSPVVTFGHSMGAIPAVGVAAGRPSAVRHVVLEDPVRTTPRAARSQERRRRRVRALQELDEAGRVELARREHPDWPEDELAPWARSKAEVDLAHLRVPADWGEPLAARLADVRCPVTIVRGVPARGGLVSGPAARRVAAMCRAGCEIAALDAGHNVRREARSQFVATLAAVLARYQP